MNLKPWFLRWAVVGLGLMMLGLSGPAVCTAEWVWKSSETPDDVTDFLSGKGMYKQPIAQAKICAEFKNGAYDFTVFYKSQAAASNEVEWVWKKATDADDVLRLLNGTGPYRNPVIDAQICALVKQTSVEFIVFYRPGKQEQPKGRWGWKMSTDEQDMVKHLAGLAPYNCAVMTVRMAAAVHEGQTIYYAFYQFNAGPMSNPQWCTKHSQDPTDIAKYLNGQSPYTQAILAADVCAFPLGNGFEYVVFGNPGPALVIQSPLPDERFIRPEEISCRVMVTSDQPVSDSAITWTSDKNGQIGKGRQIKKSQLNLGPHVLTVQGLGTSAQVAVRIFQDLDAFYRAKPSPAEAQRTLGEFNLLWKNGTLADEQWDAYGEYYFNQQSVDPSKLVVLARLDVLRHQRFSRPFPFDTQTIFDHFKTYVKNIEARLDCDLNHAITEGISLARTGSVWDQRISGACKQPLENPVLQDYIDPLSLMVHECRHLQPGAPGHVSGPSWIEPDVNPDTARDAALQNGDGYAWAALYYMWVYKYGLFDTQDIKRKARSNAKDLLRTRFCAEPAYFGNKDVEAVVKELVQEIKNESRRRK